MFGWIGVNGRWKDDVPWARRGEVTVALGGDLSKEADLLPAEALAVQTMVPLAPPIAPVPVATPRR